MAACARKPICVCAQNAYYSEISTFFFTNIRFWAKSWCLITKRKLFQCSLVHTSIGKVGYTFPWRSLFYCVTAGTPGNYEIWLMTKMIILPDIVTLIIHCDEQINSGINFPTCPPCHIALSHILSGSYSLGTQNCNSHNLPWYLCLLC